MINNIISFSIKNKLIVGLFTLALLVGGIWSALRVPLDAVPDITNNQVQVITQSPSLGTEDIEQLVTYPVEIAMANLPGVTEIRSISRFGLSVVTVVFKDDMGTYLPRQLVAEKLNKVNGEIPEGFGEPSMGPISTGLGEIYQYTLKVQPEFKDKYSSTDLRTMQDWIVARQMAMVPGVVEINAIGGKSKQYEVAVDPNKLKAFDVTILEVFEALKVNNQNTGGAYIEKNHQANFIRGEGLARSLKDIEAIVVKNINDVPITIKDVGTVQYGSAVRYGALTQDGEGEVVGGLVMMLKGANSNDVIERVKDRMTEIQKSLPEGVVIEPLLDRSSLIAKTTSTVSTNLLEGALIVIFILVLLLGNWRGGLIVASTIPLSLLFAFILMDYFGVWANLMSLGAIDFGIIIDGAVIIVESTVFMLHSKVLGGKKLNAKTKDDIAYKASSKMMNSAFFGQLIILIVFIPILALQGVEGKMFKPMAFTFMFAMVGVMILCLTYVPMMSAWLIKPSKNSNKKSWGEKITFKLEEIYGTLLAKALKKGKLVITGAVAFLAIAIFTFSQMGGEFVPQLDEGDIAFHGILKPGSSLTETIETTTKIEKLVKQTFPEVDKIVSRIGVAEVPTDPMPMDIADIFVILKPQSEWTTVSSKAELVEKMKTIVEQIPGVNYEFTQPIEMRFNELLEGVREDIAIKLYGEDINTLAIKAEEISKIIAGTDGIGDMKVEATTGLPQLTVNYDRQKLAQYGLNISELNTIVQSSFSGGKAGVIFEGEKRFDLVVRLDSQHKEDIEDLKNLFIQLPNNSQIPLKEVALISYKSGPMQISRDNTNRRTYVGVNVRGRDVKSLVHEIQKKLDAELKLPPGYYIRYGGAFENLERATKRLTFVVPIALGLIFLLIFFALKSVKQTAMIYIAIPLAAIGGVFSLWLRDMPFSISAGVGFIVLFGVAVLDGLVLMSGWNELSNEDMDLNTRIITGAKRRMRPVIITTLTDILGFIPMAISLSAGAEVQRPLATVVIGGMFTATLLILFILPILYQWVESKKRISMSKSSIAMIVTIGFTIISVNEVKAQTITSEEQAIKIAMENNGKVRSAESKVALAKSKKKAAVDLSKTDIGIQYGQYNSFENDFAFDVNQNFEFPSVYSAQRKANEENVLASELEKATTESQLKLEVRTAWNQLCHLIQIKGLLLFQDSLYSKFSEVTNLRYELEATNYLEKVSAETQSMETKNKLRITQSNIKNVESRLSFLLNDTANYSYKPKLFEELELSSSDSSLAQNPMLQLAKQQVQIAKADKKVERAKLLPEFSLGYFNQSLIGSETSVGNIAKSSNRFSGIQAGISIPLFYGSYKANITSAEIEHQIAETEANYLNSMLQSQFEQQLNIVMMNQNSLVYYKNQAIPQANLILKNAQKSFENGAISYIEYFQNVKQAIQIKFSHLNTLKDYNQSVLRLEQIIGY